MSKKYIRTVFDCADNTCLANRDGLCFKNRIVGFTCNSKTRKRDYKPRRNLRREAIDMAIKKKKMAEADIKTLSDKWKKYLLLYLHTRRKGEKLYTFTELMNKAIKEDKHYKLLTDKQIKAIFKRIGIKT